MKLVWKNRGEYNVYMEYLCLYQLFIKVFLICLVFYIHLFLGVLSLAWNLLLIYDHLKTYFVYRGSKNFTTFYDVPDLLSELLIPALRYDYIMRHGGFHKRYERRHKKSEFC